MVSFNVEVLESEKTDPFSIYFIIQPITEKSQKKYIDEIKLSCYNKTDSTLCWIF